MSSAGYNYTATSGVSSQIFDAAEDGGGSTTFAVRCLTESDSSVLVNIPGLHAVDDWYRIPAGEKELFRVQNRGISEVHVKGLTDDALIDFGSISVTA